MTPTSFVKRTASAAPVEVPATASLASALDTLDSELEPSCVTTAILVWATAVLFALSLGLTVLDALGVLAASSIWLAGIALAVAVLAAAAHAAPTVLAARRQAVWAGAVPGFVFRAALGMRLTPTLEAGVRAAFDADDSLTARVNRVHGRPATDVLAGALDGIAPHATRASGLLAAAATADDPPALIDRATDAGMQGTRQVAREYAAGLHGPVTAIYAFGVVLPLALVGILPAAPLAGYRLPLTGLALALDVALPACVLAATAWLLAHRPRVIPPPRIPDNHPSLGSPTTVAATALAGILVAVLCAPLLPPWAIWLLVPTWGVGGALLARYQPALDAGAGARETRAALPDLLALLGGAMADGAPPETALVRAGAGPGAAAAIARDAATVRERLGIHVRAALTGGAGPLDVLGGQQAETVGALVAAAGAAGPHGGRALAAYADHLDDLHALERDVRADLARITGTLEQTAAGYAPAIGGVTVALATRLRDTSSTLPPPGDGFALVVGGYVVVLAAVLPILATTLADGWCRVRIGVSVGRALVVAGGIFPLVAQLAATVL